MIPLIKQADTLDFEKFLISLDVICTSKMREKIIAAQLHKYQPIRGRKEERKERCIEKKETDVEAVNRDTSINRPPCSL